MTERELFAACGCPYPSKEEAYRIQERVGIMCGAGEPSPEAIEEARKDLKRYHDEEYLAKFPRGKVAA